MQRFRLAAVGLLVPALVAAGTPAALADHGGSGSGSGRANRGSAFPSQAEVDAAKARADQKLRDVGAIKAQLLLANQRVDRANTRAEQAAEAYNGAMWRLQRATRRLAAARADAADARRTVAGQRDRIGALVAQSYQQGTQLSALSAVLGAHGPEGVLDQYAGFQGASSSLQADYQRFVAADALAQVFERKAASAKAEQARLAADARTARDAAAAAATQAEGAAATVAAEKRTLIRQLAVAQGISVRMAQQRQAALEELARKRAEERARREAAARAKAAAAAKARAEAAAARKAAEQQAAARKAAAHRAAARRAAARKAARAATTHPRTTSAPQPAPQPAPQVTSAPARSGGAAAAIAFAKAQLGEPYLWGGAGPSAWDCSGLTQGAWAAAGVSMPHFAAAQYYAGVPESVSDARPGDLLFWTSDGTVSGIHHVALYLGGGSFLEAPHTGANVRYNSIYSWYPDFAVRM